MIHSRFGSEVEILPGDYDWQTKGEVDFRRKSDGKVFKSYLNELRANGGFAEIVDEIKKVNINGNNGKGNRVVRTYE